MTSHSSADDRPKQFLMNQQHAKSLKGKIVDRIERDGDSAKIYFTDGTAVSFSGDRPRYGRLMVYFWSRFEN
jgi:hypothetical protein